MAKAQTLDLGGGRLARLVPGYSCGLRGETCQHAHRGAHGQHPDEWHFIVGAKTQAAMVLRVCSNERDDKALEGYEPPHGTYLDLHTAFPAEEGVDGVHQLFEEPTPCEYTKSGKCYITWRSTVLTARDFWNAHGIPSLGFDVQPSAFWRALEGMRESALASARERRLDLKYEICPCCKGSRVVSRRRKSRER